MYGRERTIYSAFISDGELGPLQAIPGQAGGDVVVGAVAEIGTPISMR